MLRSITELRGCAVIAKDGELGTVDDVYFDDQKWRVRHLVIDTGGWLPGRKVLIPPPCVGGIAWADRTVRVNLTKQQIENSPSLDSDKPVSRQQEVALYEHYGFPDYWTGPFVLGATVFPAKPGADQDAAPGAQRELADADPHLRSADEINGYGIQATDDAVGHVEDLLFDETDWTLQMMVVDPRDWWPGKHVVVSLKQVEDISWADQKLVLKLSRADIENSPEFDARNPPSPPMQEDLSAHPGRSR